MGTPKTFELLNYEGDELRSSRTLSTVEVHVNRKYEHVCRMAIDVDIGVPKDDESWAESRECCRVEEEKERRKYKAIPLEKRE